MIRNRRVAGLHLDAWGTIAFLLGYFLVQPLLAGYTLAWQPWV